MIEQMIYALMGGGCRMLKDDLRKTDVKRKKPSGTADAQTQTEAPEEPAGPEPTQTPESCNGAETELRFLQWKKLCFEDEPEAWQKVSMSDRRERRATGRVTLVAIGDHLRR